MPSEGNKALLALASSTKFPQLSLFSIFILQIIDPFELLFGLTLRFPKYKDSNLSELFSPTPINPNPDSEVTPLTCIFTLNLFEADLMELLIGLTKPSNNIELIPYSSVPIYLLEIILKY